jgi:hypothetical protein
VLKRRAAQVELDFEVGALPVQVFEDLFDWRAVGADVVHAVRLRDVAFQPTAQTATAGMRQLEIGEALLRGGDADQADR